MFCTVSCSALCLLNIVCSNLLSVLFQLDSALLSSSSLLTFSLSLTFSLYLTLSPPSLTLSYSLLPFSPYPLSLPLPYSPLPPGPPTIARDASQGAEDVLSAALEACEVTHSYSYCHSH